jgi:hypothetical protein
MAMHFPKHAHCAPVLHKSLITINFSIPWKKEGGRRLRYVYTQRSLLRSLFAGRGFLRLRRRLHTTMNRGDSGSSKGYLKNTLSTSSDDIVNRQHSSLIFGKT